MQVTIYTGDGRALANSTDPQVVIRRGCKIPVRGAERNGAELTVRYYDNTRALARFDDEAQAIGFVAEKRAFFAGVMA